MTSKFWTELSNDYDKLFDLKLGYDVIIYAGEEPNVKEIHAHSSILCIRSQYFRSAFSNEWAERKDGKFILRKPNVSGNLLNIILRFLYCGNIELKNLLCSDILKLLIAVDELNIQPLISYIQEFLIEHQAEFLYKNPTKILEIVYQHETFTDLWDFCLETICEEPLILFNSDKFIDLKAPLLELLLKRDDLNTDEIDIWDSLLKWCFAQLNMKDDLKKWSKDDITKIEDLLSRFIPLIKFYDIGPEDFFYKVYCYKDILPNDLIHDLLEYHVVPNMKFKSKVAPSRKSNSKLKLDSTLIETNFNSLFASWIDKKESTYYNKKKIPYEFNLLYRSSRDEFNAASFHRNCNKKGATIWIAKIQDSTQLIGGYNPLDWSGTGWKNTSDSFLFTFKDAKNLFNLKIGYVSDGSRAVYCNSNYGPSMGDLVCSDSNNWEYDYLFNGDYPNIGIPASFTVEEYEVFQVVKKQT
ncbi:hypothetical protein RclHR1_09090008 [Rhizophagus clarus]|uniref:BTB domain-containing protein n=1 Tax=Rhizophagus clarus TaxID=94130 RepID=A0A2Z6SGS9_9GLOM|nr:hypothetical protein RclHR1_09090008 [Rhizophagus clarus]GES80939.1 hypothetical protein GLOIN_2v1471188 [Rhizophagus clarus]